MRKKITDNFKFFITKVISPVILFGVLVTQTYGANNVAPQQQDTKVEATFDLKNLPVEKILIWNDAFGGSSDACSSMTNCVGMDGVNSLGCYSTSDSKNGSCPVNVFWGTFSAPTPNKLTLIFTHQRTGQTRELQIVSRKGWRLYESWITGFTGEFTTFILVDQLKKLDRAGVWKAELRMQVKAWENCADYSPTKGCPGTHRAKWTANITFNVTDLSNQQIYLPAFPTAAPVIDLNLVTRSGASSGKTVSGSANLDMCLYDGNDSASKRVSLLFQDEGAAAAGRPKGQFSLYRQGGDKAKARDRLDYQISVINPTTGASQAVSNGTEIIWSDTNRRDIQRQVILPGVSAPALCVPAPLTLKTPAFSLADKTGGDYTGRLRIIYTPTIQTAQ